MREITDFEPSGDVQADALALTRRIADEMSAIVFQHPESYLWPHRRWRQYRRHVTGRARRLPDD
jgi:lauroyl/myristoyl acyltransferase